LQTPSVVNSRIVLLGTEQDFFLQLLEMLVPGGARDRALEAEEQGAPPPPPEAAPFEVWFAYRGTDGLDEVRRLRRIGAYPAVAMIDLGDDPEDALEIAGRLLVDDPRLQVVLVAPGTDEVWDVAADALGHRDQVVVLKRPFDGVEVRELAHVLVQRWSEMDRVLARAPRLVPGDMSVMKAGPTPALTPSSGVEVLRDAFRAIHGLVAALSARCELLEPEARAEALEQVGAVSNAVDHLRRVEHLVDPRAVPAKPADDV
jgi:two-component system, NtrC family, sensor kinase